MDYKKIIKSRELRLKILRLLSFIPDKQMLQLQYRIKTGRKLDLKNPRRYTEKLQWYKLYHKDPLMIQCVDKYDVRAYVESKGLGHILNECYGVYEAVEDIDFDKLPQQFVLKDTLGGGGNSVILVKDKSAMDLEAVKQQLHKWLAEDHRAKSGGREWPYYSGKKHRIIIEKYLAQPDGGLVDYKFFCFYGRVEYLYILADRVMGENVGLAVFDAQYNRVPVCRVDERPLERNIPKPLEFEAMKQIAQTLAQPFPEARVDLYDIGGKILFGEITFFDGSGYMTFKPDEFDFELGNKFALKWHNRLT